MRPFLPAQMRPVARQSLKIGCADMSGLLSKVANVTLLSLDCFDTIVWRFADRPVDVFSALQHEPAFKALGYTAAMRVASEIQARELAWLRWQRNEVCLREIYRAAFSELDDAQVAELEETELRLEMRLCYAVPSAIELLRDAKRRGVAVMVVSDTYLSELQLRRLLAHVLPEDAYAAIGRVIVSCEQGLSKAQGLFQRLQERYRLPLQNMLHVGDNPRADIRPLEALGISACLVEHLDEEVRERQRYQSAALSLLDPHAGQARPVHAAYHGVLASLGLSQAGADRLIGCSSLGPMMHAFGTWVLDEQAALERLGKRAKLAFLLRDGFLPHQVCETIAGTQVGRPIRLSRFAAFAASFRSVDDVDRYLSMFVSSQRFETLVRQLQLPAALGEKIIKKAKAASDPVADFVRQIHRDDVLREIFDASRRFRERLRRYLERELDLQSGDTLVFVDLGYFGTAQKVLQAVMREEWGVELLGRYLMSVHAPDARGSRAGLIDPSWCDERAMNALLPFVAPLENLCTMPEGSLEGYAEDGTPVLESSLIAQGQHERVKAIQSACLEFVREAQAFFQSSGRRPEMSMLRDAALAEFGRMIYFPSALDLQNFKNFALDINLGTDLVVQQYDVEKGGQALRREGVFYAVRHPGELRLNTPAELRYAGLELSLTMLASYRFALGLERKSWNLREEPVEALVIRGQETSQLSLAARATHDGYFSLLVPLGKGDAHVGLNLGAKYRLLQLDSLRCISHDSLRPGAVCSAERDLRGAVLLDGIDDHGDGLWLCTAAAALMIVPAGASQGIENPVVEMIFRPLSRASLQSPELVQ